MENKEILAVFKTMAENYKDNNGNIAKFSDAIDIEHTTLKNGNLDKISSRAKAMEHFYDQMADREKVLRAECINLLYDTLRLCWWDMVDFAKSLDDNKLCAFPKIIDGCAVKVCLRKIRIDDAELIFDIDEVGANNEAKLNVVGHNYFTTNELCDIILYLFNFLNIEDED